MLRPEQLDTSNSQLRAAKARIQDLELSNQEHQEESGQARDTLQGVKSDLASAEQALHDAQVLKASLQAQLKSAVESASSDGAAQASKLNAATTQVARLHHDNTDLQEETLQLQADAKRMVRQRQQLEIDLADVRTFLNCLPHMCKDSQCRSFKANARAYMCAHVDSHATARTHHSLRGSLVYCILAAWRTGVLSQLTIFLGLYADKRAWCVCARVCSCSVHQAKLQMSLADLGLQDARKRATDMQAELRATKRALTTLTNQATLSEADALSYARRAEQQQVELDARAAELASLRESAAAMQRLLRQVRP